MKIALFAVLALLSPGAFAAPCSPYEPAVVSLSGIVVYVKAYGPPGFGETPRTDAHEDYYGLKLDAPLCTIANPAMDEPAESSVTVLQMLFASRHPLTAGMRITVKGSLSHAETGHHHTLVMIDVKSVQ